MIHRALRIWGVVFVDLPVVRFAQKHGWDRLDNLVLGATAKCTNDLLIKRDKPPSPQFGWHVLLLHFKDSSVFAWPVTRVALPGHQGEFYLQFATDIKRYPMLVIDSWDGCDATTFQWRH